MERSFEQLLNRPIPETMADIPPAEHDIPITLVTPSKNEINKAIISFNNSKSAGPDRIPAEANAIETTVKTFHQLFEKIWQEETIPEEWKVGFIIKPPKKGDLSQCKSYHGNLLLSTKSF